MNDLIPEDSKQPIDTGLIARSIVDNGDFLEVQRDFAKNLIVGFGRIDGITVGIVSILAQTSLLKDAKRSRGNNILFRGFTVPILWLTFTITAFK